MNYIAHIHIAEHTQTSKLGSFLGDFVKGDQYLSLPETLQQGIKLHRRVDQFTDNHPTIKNIKSQFPTNIRRMAGVVIDIYFDHLLLSNWHSYSNLKHEQIFDEFYAELQQFSLPNHPHFNHLALSLTQNRWLAEYANFNTCYNAFKSIERRLNQRIKFAEASLDYIQQERVNLHEQFNQFYPDLLDYSYNQVKAN